MERDKERGLSVEKREEEVCIMIETRKWEKKKKEEG